MKTSIYLILLSISCSLILFSCNYTLKVTDGKMAYDLKRYSEAAPMLEKEYKRTKESSEKAKIAYLAAESYAKMNRNDKAMEWYKSASDNGSTAATVKYAYSLKRAEMYEEAATYFSDLAGVVDDAYEMRKEMRACQEAMVWKKEEDKNPYRVEKTTFNSSNADYSPTRYKDNSIVISSDRPVSTGNVTYQWTGNDFSDLFIINTETSSTEVFPYPINTEYNEGTLAFNKDFTSMIFSRCGTSGDDDDYCKLMTSDYDGEKWSLPQILPFVLDGVNYAHPTWDSEGTYLYFTSDEPEGWGGFDIYRVKYSNGLWNDPQILSGTINTDKDDMFPSFDDSTFYFASEGRGGMGGLDIYKSTEETPNKWTDPVNLKAPINSGEDDFGFLVVEKTEGDEKSERGYFSSARNGGEGGDDIYAYSLKEIEPEVIPEPEIDTPDVVIPEPIPDPEPPKVIFLEVYVYGKTHANPNDPKSAVTGKMAIPNAGLQINSPLGQNRETTDNTGMYRFKIEKGLDYRFFASSSDYFNKTAIFNTSNREEKEVYRLDILLDKIFRNVEIKLDNIYYDFDKWDIREDAKPTLNKLANILLQNPNIKINLGSHTDCRGKEAYNQNLSQKRAQSAVDYLATLGVDPSRLTATGYGESSPAISCNCNSCTDDEHQINRRTTFRIVD